MTLRDLHELAPGESRRYICPDCGREREDIVALTYHRMGCREDQKRRTPLDAQPETKHGQ